MTAQNKNVMNASTDRPTGPSAPKMNAKLELALDLWLSEMSGSSDQTAHMAARLAQLEQRRAA